MKKRKKKIKYHISALGDGRYNVTWQEGNRLYDLVFNDKYEVEKARQMKNPYPHNQFPMVVINWPDEIK